MSVRVQRPSKVTSSCSSGQPNESQPCQPASLSGYPPFPAPTKALQQRPTTGPDPGLLEAMPAGTSLGDQQALLGIESHLFCSKSHFVLVASTLVRQATHQHILGDWQALLGVGPKQQLELNMAQTRAHGHVHECWQRFLLKDTRMCARRGGRRVCGLAKAAGNMGWPRMREKR